MEQLYKLVNGVLQPCPESFVTENGYSISNFPSVAKDYGYKPLRYTLIPIIENRWEKVEYSYEELDEEIIQKATIAPRFSLEEYKQQRIDKFNEICNKTILGKFTSQGKEFIFDYEAQMNFTQQAVLLSMMPNVITISWKTESHGIISLTREEFFQVINDANTFKRAWIGYYWFKKGEILDCQSYEEVDAVVW